VAGSSGAGGSSSGISGSSSGGSSSGSGGTAKSLVGTWDLMTTPMESTGSITTTVVIGQDSLTVTSPDFSLTAVRTGNAVAYTDEQTPGSPGNNIVLTATQTVATFDTGILPFNLGGTWSMTVVQGGKNVGSCTLSVSSTEVDGACSQNPGGPFFSFTTKKMSPGTSVLGDFGGKWMNTFIDPGKSASYPCELDFIGSSITTCTRADGGVGGNPLSGITFTYDGANTASGAAQGWAEYSATRQ
jgi:hypothetical protein